MVRTRHILLVAALLAVTTEISAGWKVVLDTKCVQAVSTNLASQKLIEDSHNKRLDSIAARKQKLELYTVTMATMKELYKLTMQNVSGFGTESKYYTEIGRCALDIILDVPDLAATVSKAGFTNRLLCLTELAGLVTETQQLVADFVNIVNNATVENPLGERATAATVGDGYNFMDRYERLTMANTIHNGLMRIRYKVEGMKAMARYATLNDLLFTIDPGGWVNVLTAGNQVDALIINWNGLVSEVWKDNNRTTVHEPFNTSTT